MAGKIAALRNSCGALVAAGLVAGMMPQPAVAQVDDRLNRIETQLRALQRAVFPGGDERFFEPEITAEEGEVRTVSTPSTSALTDVLTRLDGIELQLARLTAATEVNENALALLEMRVSEMEQSALAAASAPPTGVIEVGEEGEEGEQGLIEVPVEMVEAPEQVEQVEGPTPERLAAVQEISKPATDDAADDEYVYGFRLWDAGFFPEAQQQLSLFVDQYPDHWRTTYGRNLLGRSFLDAGEARRAATHFFENYQADKQAARAPDSLLYLSESMIQLNDTRRACIALAEFGDTYPALATGRLQEQYENNMGRVDCE